MDQVKPANEPGKLTPSFDPSARAARIIVHGVVQGVGFRPFIHRLASRFNLYGWVRNTGLGVEIHLEGKDSGGILGFLQALEKEKPPLALVESVEVLPAEFEGSQEFIIIPSRQEEAFVFISPDIATCEACLQEITDPKERRYRYPFTNCTNCGPRYTIVQGLPYDRERTTMASFRMCEACRREYHDPDDRRHHAQPIACPVCGPSLSLLDPRTGEVISGGLEKAADLIQEGSIVAVKGLGGFHLMADPRNPEAIRRLRQVKNRRFKPLALMARNLATVKKFARVNEAEAATLVSPYRPIVLLQKEKELAGVAPFLQDIGFMLPYTPLHHLLLEKIDLVVATSSNRKDAPIAKDEKEGIAELCDYILTHNRPIAMRADDSVLKIVEGEPLFLRRARGYVPYPEKVIPELRIKPHVLGLGGELKVTISAYKSGTVVTSQFLGDLDEYQNYLYFEEALNHFTRLFHLNPEIVVSDLHPHFRTTRFASQTGWRHLQVQHHYAHVLAAFLEHRLPPATRVLGVSFDGYGYGLDGAAWGGEFLLADGFGFERLAHFSYVPLPGGDLAARQPWRMALAHLLPIIGPNPEKLAALVGIDEGKVGIVLSSIRHGFNAPPTSSCGRLFDAVACLLAIAPAEMEFEAEAAMRLEAIAGRTDEKPYPVEIEKNNLPWKVSFRSMTAAILEEKKAGVFPEIIASRFHRTVVEAILAVAREARKEFNLTNVILSGVFLNRWLTHIASQMLRQAGFKVWRAVRYSPNDESISLGQVYFALSRLAAEGSR